MINTNQRIDLITWLQQSLAAQGRYLTSDELDSLSKRFGTDRDDEEMQRKIRELTRPDEVTISQAAYVLYETKPKTQSQEPVEETKVKLNRGQLVSAEAKLKREARYSKEEILHSNHEAKQAKTQNHHLVGLYLDLKI